MFMVSADEQVLTVGDSLTRTGQVTSRRPQRGGAPRDRDAHATLSNRSGRDHRETEAITMTSLKALGLGSRHAHCHEHFLIEHWHEPCELGLNRGARAQGAGDEGAGGGGTRMRLLIRHSGASIRRIAKYIAP